MHLRLLTFLVALAACALSLPAQSLTAHRDKVKDGYNFWLYTPPLTKTFDVVQVKADSAETGAGDAPERRVLTRHVATSMGVPKPVIIFLHGASLCGRDLDRVRTYGTIDAIEKGRDIDAIVIAPQNPGGAWAPRKVMNVLDWVSERHSVDSSRIYVIGMSLGGYGTLDVVASYPERIAAAMAFCGGTTKDPELLDNVPLWIVHGTADRAVSVSQSDRIASTLKAKGGGKRLIYDRVAGMNHGAPARLFYLSESYDWLLQHSLDDDDRVVATNSIIGSNLIRNAYDGLNFRKGSTASVKKSARKTTRKTARKTTRKTTAKKTSAKRTPAKKR